QREDLNPIETARAFQRLVEEFGYTQETVAQRVGKDRSTVANAMRLLKLPPDVLEMVESGQLSEGHGRAILGAPDASTMKRIAHETVEKAWSVRETERRARHDSHTKSSGGGTKAPGRSANVRDLEERLSKSLGARVRVKDKKGKGRLEIPYISYEDLDRILAKLLG
ncbi:MAG: ParB/RepB/Spo0J family partition protein, partial [Myxococcales bacterium]|nr:ParB/RepB/Spo0J family partition protein [Myxococcales bacterium]